jgi:hypothetical protein
VVVVVLDMVQSSHALPFSDGHGHAELVGVYSVGVKLRVVEVVIAGLTYRELVVVEVVDMVQSSHALPFSEGQGQAEP